MSSEDDLMIAQPEALLLPDHLLQLSEYDDLPKDIFMNNVLEGNTLLEDLGSRAFDQDISYHDQLLQNDSNGNVIQHDDQNMINQNAAKSSQYGDANADADVEIDGTNLMMMMKNANDDSNNEHVLHNQKALHSPLGSILLMNATPVPTVAAGPGPMSARQVSSTMRRASASIVKLDIFNDHGYGSCGGATTTTATLTKQYGDMLSPRTMLATTKLNILSLNELGINSTKPSLPLPVPAPVPKTRGSSADWKPPLMSSPPKTKLATMSSFTRQSTGADAADNPIRLFTRTNSLTRSTSDITMPPSPTASTIGASLSIDGEPLLKRRGAVCCPDVNGFNTLNFQNNSNSIPHMTSHGAIPIPRSRSTDALMGHQLRSLSPPCSNMLLSTSSSDVSSLAHYIPSRNGSPPTVRSPTISMRRVFSTGDLQELNSHRENSSPRGSASSAPKIGNYTLGERKVIIQRYRQKRNERNFSKKIKYACRKTLADSRPRVRGRFAKTDEIGDLSVFSSSSARECDLHCMNEYTEDDDLLMRNTDLLPTLNGNYRRTIISTPAMFWDTNIGTKVAM